MTVSVDFSCFRVWIVTIFDKWLEKYPNRFRSNGKSNKWGSAKHCYSVEKCIQIINENFILLDSDILIKRDVSSLWDETKMYVGEVINQPKSSIKRILPYICFLNVKMMKEHNVHYFDQEYMHGLKYTVDGDMYDTGAGFYLAAKKYPSKQIKTDEYAIHYSGGSWAKEKELKYKHAYTPEQWLTRYVKLWGNMDKRKNVVYTCITGEYDSLMTDIKTSDNFDYVCFTDNMSLDGGGIWELRPIPSEVNGYSKVKQQRYVKICAHKVLPEYEQSIWIDANVLVRGSVDDFVNEKCAADYSVFIPKHPNRTCIYKEAEAVLRLKKDKKEIVAKQMSRYRSEHFPENYGLVQSNIMFRRHNDESCIRLMEAWWEELSKESHRDQLSFNYALWKNKDAKFAYLDKDTCNSIYFLWKKTHGKRPTVNKPPQEDAVSQIHKVAVHPQQRTKYKPMMKVGSRTPRTKSMKTLLSLF